MNKNNLRNVLNKQGRGVSCKNAKRSLCQFTYTVGITKMSKNDDNAVAHLLWHVVPLRSGTCLSWTGEPYCKK